MILKEAHEMTHSWSQARSHGFLCKIHMRPRGSNSDRCWSHLFSHKIRMRPRGANSILLASHVASLPLHLSVTCDQVDNTILVYSL